MNRRGSARHAGSLRSKSLLFFLLDNTYSCQYTTPTIVGVVARSSIWAVKNHPRFPKRR
jgi:hypothetical protein